MVDVYGVGFFMVVIKVKGMIVVEVLDECLVYMIRVYNNVRMIILGLEIVGLGVVKYIVEGFVDGIYDVGCY